MESSILVLMIICNLDYMLAAPDYQDGKALASDVNVDYDFLPSPRQKEQQIHWSYGTRNGPKEWGGKCHQGRRQSPVNIELSRLDWARPIEDKIEWGNYDQKGPLELRNNGHGVIANGFAEWPPTERPFIRGGGLPAGIKYKLLQFHFHWARQNNAGGSEHAINGLHYPAELHFVHIRDGLSLSEALLTPDGIAAVGIFYQIGQQGKNAGKALAALEKPLRMIVEKNSSTPIVGFSPSILLPRNRGDFFTYAGSLTTPGCEEAVIWTILANPQQITSEQLSLLRALHGPITGDGQQPIGYVRPIQPLNGRQVRIRLKALTNGLEMMQRHKKRKRRKRKLNIE